MLNLQGVTGEIRWSYMTAAVFGPWRIEAGNDRLELTAHVVSSDDYRMGQSPLIAAVQIGRQRMTFPVISLQVVGGTLTAALGPRHKDGH